MSESQTLLHEHNDSDSNSDTEPAQARQLSPGSSQTSPRHSSASLAAHTRPNGNGNGYAHGKRQSSFAQPRPDGTPRTPNRVRFQEEPLQIENGYAQGGEWIELEDEDYMDSHGSDGADGRERVQRLPLLTGIEAPSVTLATEDFSPEDHLESARPRSGMRSAFLNMANSIMCVPVPYCAARLELTSTVALESLASPMPFAMLGSLPASSSLSA